MANKRSSKGADLKIISEEHPEFVGRIANFFVKNKDMIGYLIVGVLAVVAVTVLMRINAQTKEAEAAVQLQNAISQYTKDRAATSISLNAQTESGEITTPEMKVEPKSIGAFQAVFDNYPSTHAGKNALYMVGVSQLNQGNYSEAIQTFDNFLGKHVNSVLAPSAALGKATAQFNNNAVSDSLNTLNALTSDYPDFYLKDVVAYEIAKRHEALDNIPKARELYQEVVSDFPDSQWKNMSEQALERLDKEHPENDNGNA